MKLTLSTNQIRENINTFMRRAGYVPIRDRRTGNESYVRRLSGGHYPRFHCYIFEQGGQVTFNLHLDQRQTRYAGAKAHAGEYDSPLVHEELDRLEGLAQHGPHDGDSFTEITQQQDKPKKSWWPF